MSFKTHLPILHPIYKVENLRAWHTLLPFDSNKGQLEEAVDRRGRAWHCIWILLCLSVSTALVVWMASLLVTMFLRPEMIKINGTNLSVSNDSWLPAPHSVPLPSQNSNHTDSTQHPKDFSWTLSPCCLYLMNCRHHCMLSECCFCGIQHTSMEFVR